MSQELLPTQDPHKSEKKRKKRGKDKSKQGEQQPASQEFQKSPKKRKKHEKTAGPPPATAAAPEFSAAAPQKSFISSIKDRIWGRADARPQDANAEVQRPPLPSGQAGQGASSGVQAQKERQTGTDAAVENQDPAEHGKQKKRKRRSSPQPEDQSQGKLQTEEKTTDEAPATPKKPRKRRKRDATVAAAADADAGPSTSQSSAAVPLGQIQKTIGQQNGSISSPQSDQRVTGPELSSSGQPESTTAEPTQQKQPSSVQNGKSASKRPNTTLYVAAEEGGEPNTSQAASTSKQSQSQKSSRASSSKASTSKAKTSTSTQRKKPRRAEDVDSNEEEDGEAGTRGRGRPRKSDAQRLEEITTNLETGQPLSFQEILISRILKPHQLKLLEAHYGQEYVKGPFKQAEDEALKTYIDHYCDKARLDIDGFRDLLFQEGALKGESFWTDLTAQVKGRPMTSVYHHIRRMFRADARQGQWTQAEDKKLQRLVKLYGRAWESISGSIGSRTGPDCKDRWDNHVRFQDAEGHVKNSGTWTDDEEQNLIEAVRAVERELDGDESKGQILWAKVAERVGTRSRQQCALKWVESTRAKVQFPEEGITKVKWRRKKDTLELLRRIRAADVEFEDEIPWRRIQEETQAFAPFSASQLRKRWIQAKRNAVSNPDDTAEIALPDMVEMAMTARKAKTKRSMPESMQKEADELWAQKERLYGEKLGEKRKKRMAQQKSAEFVEDSAEE